MPRTANCPVFQLAKKQEGVISYAQLRRLGVTEMGRRIRLLSGEWIKVLPSVLRLYWADETWMQRVWAASLWVDRGGCISHRTAAVLAGFAIAHPETIDVISMKPLRVARRWMVVHRTRAVLLKTQVAGGIRIASPAQTLLDLAGTLTALELQTLIREACRQGVISCSQLRAALPRLSSHGKAGRGRLRQALSVVQRQFN